MRDYVNDYLLLTRNVQGRSWVDEQTHRKLGLQQDFEYLIQKVRPHLYMSTGLRLSIQASNTHYCTPQSVDGPWTHVEVAVQGGKLLLTEWSEYSHDSGEIYGWVPVELVNREIELNGGISNG